MKQQKNKKGFWYWALIWFVRAFIIAILSIALAFLAVQLLENYDFSAGAWSYENWIEANK